VNTDPRERAAANPFLVLGLAPSASSAEVEREARRLLDALDLGFEDALRYATPFGPRPRTPEAVRDALQELRDPERRAHHEIFARARDACAAGVGVAPWPGAFDALGWGRR
jgi:hypothetical protein